PRPWPRFCRSPDIKYPCWLHPTREEDVDFGDKAASSRDEPADLTMARPADGGRETPAFGSELGPLVPLRCCWPMVLRMDWFVRLSAFVALRPLFRRLYHNKSSSIPEWFLSTSPSWYGGGMLRIEKPLRFLLIVLLAFCGSETSAAAQAPLKAERPGPP